jgi:hypothetical protein
LRGKPRFLTLKSVKNGIHKPSKTGFEKHPVRFNAQARVIED